MEYKAKDTRYDALQYRRCGKSGLLLPPMSLGLWHNFGAQADFDNAREILLGAFDCGITHFDLANNYGPPAGSAEETFGRVLTEDIRQYRDEITVSTKAGYAMWSGPYGEWGSKKSLVASIDQSLIRMKLDYVDIFYHHRPDPNTPMEETADALAGIIKSGKALYIGISNYSPVQTQKMVSLLQQQGVHCLIHQMCYSMLNRENEAVLDVLDEEGVGSIAFSPLAQGVLTGKYNQGIPEGSRAAGGSAFLSRESICSQDVVKAIQLEKIAQRRGQTLAQMALAWVLRGERVTSVILGASRLSQIKDNLKALEAPHFDWQELTEIDAILKGESCRE